MITLNLKDDQIIWSTQKIITIENLPLHLIQLILNQGFCMYGFNSLVELFLFFAFAHNDSNNDEIDSNILFSFEAKIYWEYSAFRIILLKGLPLLRESCTSSFFNAFS